ncbi:strictosidine synthase [Mesorhizobium sp. Cs1330R2N1]|uniref:Strictosidine synthase n=1 Tax=Mesorhizobium argentiipisi TaxID=3015175 RepID=A0ABU8KC46_9HYPH
MPVYDGPLQANDLLENAAVIARLPAPDNLVLASEATWLSSGRNLCRVTLGSETGYELVQPFDSEISSLAASPEGAIAIGLDGVGIVIRGGPHDGYATTEVMENLTCPTAAAFVDENTLLVANGSADNNAADWKRDLMERRSSGSVVKLDLANGKSELLADGLAFPAGIARGPNNCVLISEAWKHRVVSLEARSVQPAVVLSNLPGYPSRIEPARSGGYWLSVFAPRNQLVEFVLKEDQYRQQMLKHIEPGFWIAPALSSGTNFGEPLQGGAVKQMGLLKPWAPTLSYGLVIRCGAEMQPLRGFHSRAGGTRHGVTATLDYPDGLLVAAKGTNVVVLIAKAESGQL